jgi:DNA processing protein
VLANGLSEIYPPEHEALAEEIAEAGAVVSEMPMRQGPLSELFPRPQPDHQRRQPRRGDRGGRPQSGSLVTAHHAMEQNREVFAVPGPVDSLASRGCHRLIRDGAKLVETVEDILDELGPLVREVRPEDGATPVRHRPSCSSRTSNARSSATWTTSRRRSTRSSPGPAWAASQVMATLSVLEMRRLIRRVPGNQFVRL